MESDNNNHILNNVNDIEKKVKELEKEKEDIQQSCNHKDGNYINFDDKKSIKKFCSTCKREIGFATIQEQEDFLKPKG